MPSDASTAVCRAAGSRRAIAGSKPIIEQCVEPCSAHDVQLDDLADPAKKVRLRQRLQEGMWMKISAGG